MEREHSDNTPIFDYIADVYDETRGPLAQEVLQFLVDYLSDSKSILEIGTGTGRISIPLQNSGFDITGVDVSNNMLEKARTKGLKKAVLADGTNLPFQDNSFDVTIIVHVFHLISSRQKVLSEALRVSKKKVISIMRVREQRANDINDNPRRRFGDILKDIALSHGYKLEIGNIKGNPLRREASILEEFPPDAMKEIGVFSTELTRDQIAKKMLSSSRFIRFMRSVPEPEKREIKDEFLKRVSLIENFRITRTSKEFLAVWEKVPD
jgi:ubiquinone/menaquinone biosynthesis C-methylase UbiE